MELSSGQTALPNGHGTRPKAIFPSSSRSSRSPTISRRLPCDRPIRPAAQEIRGSRSSSPARSDSAVFSVEFNESSMGVRRTLLDACGQCIDHWSANVPEPPEEPPLLAKAGVAGSTPFPAPTVLAPQWLGLRHFHVLAAARVERVERIGVRGIGPLFDQLLRRHRVE